MLYATGWLETTLICYIIYQIFISDRQIVSGMHVENELVLYPRTEIKQGGPFR